MSRNAFSFCLALAIGLNFLPTALAGEEAASDKAAETPKYLLRYSFRPGEKIRWKVVHQALVRTTVSGTTQTAETRSESVKLWEVKEIDETAGQATFVHSVESVDMRQSVSGRQDVRYNSETDQFIPSEFEDVAKAVDVPLSTIVLSNQGHVVKRHEERAQPHAANAEMTLPLPDKAVAVNDKWSFPHDTSVRQKDGSNKQVKTRQDFTLVEVDNGIATIRVETVVLTPIRDPALEAQLIQHVTDGTVRFDIAAGRVVGQQTDIDKRVIGFQGEASSLHYVTRFTEELLPEVAATASRAPVRKERLAPEKVTESGSEEMVLGQTPAETAKEESKADDVAAKEDIPAAATEEPALTKPAATEAAEKGTPAKTATDKAKPAVAAAPGKPAPGARPAPPPQPSTKATTRNGAKPAVKPAAKPATKQATKQGTSKTKTGSKPATTQQQRR